MITPSKQVQVWVQGTCLTSQDLLHHASFTSRPQGQLHHNHHHKHQMTTDQQPPPGYQFQQYYPVTPPVQAQLNPVNPITPITPVAQKSTSTSVVMPDTVDSKTEQTQKQNEKDSDKESKQKGPESPLTETLPQDQSNGESIYLKLTKSDLEKPEWKWLLVNYSNDDDKPDQGPQSVKPNETVTVMNIPQQMPPVAPPTSVTQQMPPVSSMSAVQPVPPPVPPLVPPVIGQPMYYSGPQYISGSDVLIQTAASLLQPKNMP